MKIAMIGHKRIPSREGGVEIVVEELSTRMVELGHEVNVYNRKKQKKDDSEIEINNIKDYKGVKIIPVFTFQKMYLNAIVYSVIATIKCLFHHYDIVHYHAEGPCSMLWLPHLFGIRTVATIHGLDWKRAKWAGFGSKYLKFGEKVAVKYADEIIVLSKDLQKYFKETYNRNTKFITNAVNKPEYKEAKNIKDKWNLEKDSYILFLARIVPEKGLHYLIDAFKNIETDKKLVIAGGASHTNDYVKKIIKQIDNDNRIIMTGFVSGNILDELYSNAFLYVLPSDLEGMPISLLEAMSYGCNVLTSDIKECTQISYSASNYFEKSNIKSLECKLVEILEKPKPDTSKSVSQILKKYNWDSVVKKTLSVYKNR